MKTKRKVMMLCLTLLLAGALFVTACGDEGGTTTTTTTTTQAPSAWNPDGVVSSGEYSTSKVFGIGAVTLTAHWKSDGQFIYMALEAPVTGYIAIGIANPIAGVGKTNTDMILGYVTGGQTFVFDQWATTETGSIHPNDTEQGGQNSIVQSGGAETVGKTIIEFKRLLNTGDAFDRPFVTGTNQIMWAIHSNLDELAQHTGAGRGDITI